MRRLCSTVALAACAILAAGPAAARNVYYVDNARGVGVGAGTYEKPFTTLAQAQAASGASDVIYVAEGNAPYEGPVTLKKGQMLIGAAYGLDAAKVDFKADMTAPPVPAVQGPGPTIHGGIWATGDNVIAGCTIVAESGSAIGAFSPAGPIVVRKTYIRTSIAAVAVALGQCGAPVTIEGGGIQATANGTGVSIDGGMSNITFDHFPISGAFTSAVAISNRTGGAVMFRNGSKIAVDDARSAIVIANCNGTITFDSPVVIATRNGRGIVINNAGPIAFSGGASRVATKNGAALDVHRAKLTATFDSVSAEGVPPGVLREGIVIDGLLAGKLSITGNEGEAASGGTIRNAQAYGIRIAQANDIRLGSMRIEASGSVQSDCPEDVGKNTTVRCAAALYLRHVTRSKLSDMAIAGGAATGVNANNVRDVSFDGLQVSGTGTDANDPAILMQEAGGTITFTRCSISDGAGGALVAEQRFNSGQIVIDRCDISAANRLTAAPALVRVQTFGTGRLQLRLNGLHMHDNAGAGFALAATDGSALSLAIDGSFAQTLGSFADVAANQSSHVAFALHETRVAAPTSNRPLIAIEGGAPGATTSACIDVTGSSLLPASGAPPIRVHFPSSSSQVSVVGTLGPLASVDVARPVAAAQVCQ